MTQWLALLLHSKKVLGWDPQAYRSFYVCMFFLCPFVPASFCCPATLLGAPVNWRVGQSVCVSGGLDQNGIGLKKQEVALVWVPYYKYRQKDEK